MKHIQVTAVALAAVVVGLLAGCSAAPSGQTAAVDSSSADEAAIRQTLADIERRINQDDLSFVDHFADDAVIMAPSSPNVEGLDAIRTLYAATMDAATMRLHFTTDEIVVAGDLAYERGTYTLTLTDHTSGEVLQDVTNKHIHIFRRESDGSWKTWRLMVTEGEPPQAAAE